MKWKKGVKTGFAVAGRNSLNQLSCPYGLIVNEVGDLYVAEHQNDRIIFWASGSNQLIGSVSLSFNVKNNIYVTEWKNNRIQRFSDINGTKKICNIKI